MADFGSPATANYTAPDGLATLGNLMSLRQKQQGLESQQLQIQGQQSQNQSLAAKAQTDTRVSNEQAKLAQIPWDTFEKEDGSYDVDAARKMAMRVAPTTGAEFAQRLNETTKGAAETKQAFQNLALQQQQGIRSALGTWGADPKSSLPDLLTQAEAAKANAPDATRTQLSKVVDHAVQAISGPNLVTGQPKTLQEQKAAAVGFSRAGLSNAEVSGPQGLATPQNVNVDSGAQIQPSVQAPALSGGGITAAGPPITKGISPGWTLTEDPVTHNKYMVNQQTGESKPVGVPFSQKPPPNAPTAPPQRAAGEGEADVTTAKGSAENDVTRSKEVSDAQQASAAAIPLTQRIDQLAKDINSGGAAKTISETGNYLGISSINEVRSQLTKDLGQVKGLAIAKSGSDARAATVLEGYPTDKTPEKTIHAAMDYIRGTARQNLARGEMLTKQGTKGFQAADNMATRTADPLMHEFMALKPEERAGFYQRNFATPQQAQEFKDHVTALKNHTSVLK